MEFASGGDLEKVSISPSSCTPTSKENGSIKETPKSSKKVCAFLYLVLITNLYTPTEWKVELSTKIKFSQLLVSLHEIPSLPPLTIVR